MNKSQRASLHMHEFPAAHLPGTPIHKFHHHSLQPVLNLPQVQFCYVKMIVTPKTSIKASEGIECCTAALYCHHIIASQVDKDMLFLLCQGVLLRSCHGKHLVERFVFLVQWLARWATGWLRLLCQVRGVCPVRASGRLTLFVK